MSTNTVSGNQSKTVDMSRGLRQESGLRARIEGRPTARPALGQDPKATYQRFAMSLEPIYCWGFKDQNRGKREHESKF